MPFRTHPSQHNRTQAIHTASNEESVNHYSQNRRSERPIREGQDRESRQNIRNLQNGRRQEPQVDLEDVDNLWNDLENDDESSNVDFDLPETRPSSRTVANQRRSAHTQHVREVNAQNQRKNELQRSVTDLKTKLNQKIDDNSDLTSDLRSQLKNDLNQQISNIQKDKDIERALDSLENLNESFSSRIEQRGSFARNLADAQREISRSLENNRSLTRTTREELKTELNNKISQIRNERDFERASSKLERLSDDFQALVNHRQDEVNTRRNQDRNQYFDKVSTGLDSLISADLTHGNYVNANMKKVVSFQGQWWDGEKHWLVKDLVNSYYGNAKELASKIKSYAVALKASQENGGATPGTSDIRTFVEGLGKEESVRVVQILVGSIYKSVGKNEAELKKSLSTTLPSDVLQVLQSKLDAGKAVGNISKAEDGAKFLKYKSEGDPPHYTSQLAGDDSFVYFDPNETSNILS